MSCIVYGCPNNSLADDSVQSFSFPKDPLLLHQWVQATGWGLEQIDVNTAKICSIHFNSSDYITEIKMVEYSPCYTQILRYDAVPTLFLPTSEIVIKESKLLQSHSLKDMMVISIETENDNENITLELPPATTESKEFIELQPSTSNLVEAAGKNVRENMVVLSFKADNDHITVELPPATSESIEFIQLQPSTSNLVEPAENQAKNDAKYNEVKDYESLGLLRKQAHELRHQVDILEVNLKETRKTFERKENDYRIAEKKYKQLQQSLGAARKIYLTLQEQKSVLAKVFSESQIKILLGKKKIYWSNDDMAVGYTIRHLSSKRFYGYLTKTLQVPLPAVSSIKRWATVKKSQMKIDKTIKEQEEESRFADSE